jgi:hypothetical protein
LDSLPPEPPAIVAATDLYPRTAEEKDLCKQASHVDWLYLSIPPALVTGAIILDTQVFKPDQHPAVRNVGPSLIGLTWGVFIGSFYPSLPKCSPHFVTTAPPEGQVRTNWPIAFALFAGMTAPIVDWIALGPAVDPNGVNYTTEEQVSRVILAGVIGFGAALIPYLLPPAPLRASRKLIDIRPTVSAHGGAIQAVIRF